MPSQSMHDSVQQIARSVTERPHFERTVEGGWPQVIVVGGQLTPFANVFEQIDVLFGDPAHLSE